MVNFKGQKGQFGPFSIWRQFSQKLFDNFFSILSWNFPRRVLMDCQKIHFSRFERLKKVKFGCFATFCQKVIFKVVKVRFCPFSHNYWYYSVVTKCCPNLLHHVASLLWNQSCPIIWKVWIQFKGHFEGQKSPIWTFVIYFS